MILRSHRTHVVCGHRHRHQIISYTRASNDWWLGRLCDRLMCDVCCYSGFLRSDTLIGTVTVKLQPLETQCEVHESFDVSRFRSSIVRRLR